MNPTLILAIADERLATLRARAAADRMVRQARQVRRGQRRLRRGLVRDEIVTPQPAVAACEPSAQHA
jgi:hypothetical protein